MAYKRMGDLLVAAGAITEEELKRGLELQKGTKERLGTVLVSNGIITENALIEALQMQLGVEFIDLTRVSIPTEMAQALPKNIARQYQVVPVRMKRDELYLAMSDPLNFYAIEEARKAVRKKIVPMVATAAGVEHAIQILYSNENAAKAIEEMKREAAGQEQTAAEDNFTARNLGDDPVNSAPTIRLVNSMIERAINERASDIHVEPREDGLYVRMRIDGIMQDILTVPKDIQASVISRLKIMSALDIAERRVPQDGRFNVRMKDKEIDLRVSTLPTVFGEKIVLRLLDASGGNVTEATIGMEGPDLEKYLAMLRSRNGVILLVGPTGSGKSTTMYAMINRLNTKEVNLVTLEDPVEYHINGINQVQINEK
ncbi:MAG: Flp pilus assembly complex ATPase component TadA, partial [Oscillibacter sp.]|nr:Flp pilus assembly complex ATPase component TadA [Oscillibacter sp.]